MNRRIIACIAALVMTASVFSACGNSGSGNDKEPEISINVITDGAVTDAPVTEQKGELITVTDAEGNAVTDMNGETVTSVVTEFIDPAAAGNTAGGETAPAVTEAAPAETIAAPSEEELMNMLQNSATESKPILKEYNVDYKTRYGYNQLNDAEKKLYGDILEAVKSVKLKVDVDDSVTDEMWVKVYGCLYMQEPQLFWLTSKKVAKGKLWYWEVDQELIASMQKEITAKAGEVLGQAEGKSDYEKLKVFHDYIALHNDFVKEEGFNQTIYGGFVKGTIQCEGYAKTMQYLCDLSGIESTVIVGTNESGDTHAWNAVKLDGEWYNIDCTWDDPILSEVDHKNVRYRYFLVPDEWIHNKSHFNINQKVSGTKVTYFAPPACKSDSKNYFKVTNQLYSDKTSADAALRDKLKAVAASKLRAVEIRVSSKSVYDEITADLKGYANWIKEQAPSVTKVTSNCDPNTLVIELDLIY